MTRMQMIERALGKHQARIIEPGKRAHAAVALILNQQTDGLNVLFIERAINDQDFWSGDICFPGGRMEDFDASPRHTAERETLEELGLDLSCARYIGRLDDYAPGGLRIVISSFVYAVQFRPELNPDQHEVGDVFWFPARELGNPSRRTAVEFLYRNRPRLFPALQLKNDNHQPLWGITYRLLRNLDKVVRRPTGGRVVDKPVHGIHAGLGSTKLTS